MNAKVYYILKPLLPRRFQLFLRRERLESKLKKLDGVWPILKGSEKKPENFNDWYDNKKFALVLTHDVEHQRGYNRVRDLIEIEKTLGFKSSFFFVPERDYRVEAELLNYIKSEGFEYGVHGLKHDGKLYSSKEEFLSRAKKINYYLKEWDTGSFRSPAMHHNLDWIGYLDVECDLSTFDTDPFEPQPDGVGTIFPFWVDTSNHKNGGYVELPYTLPQDFTPLILMRQQSPKIWIDKLNWIAENNGMVLLNVHPDYIALNGKKSREEFDKTIYTDFLKYIKDNWTGEYWNALPSEISRFWRKNILQKS